MAEYLVYQPGSVRTTIYGDSPQTGPASWAPGPPLTSFQRVYTTPGIFTIDKPADVDPIGVQIWGGGGGGGGGSSSTSAGGGGGGGGFIDISVPAAAWAFGSSAVIKVGDGGAGSAHGSSGADGDRSQIDVGVTTLGQAAAGLGGARGNPGAGGNGGTTAHDVSVTVISSGNGTAGAASAPPNGGHGGNSGDGVHLGGTGGTPSVLATSGEYPGAGGGGGPLAAGAQRQAGNGRKGTVRIYWPV